MPLGSPRRDSRLIASLRISQPFDPRHMSIAPEPTLPRLTRLGPPTLTALDTDVPPLPLPPLPHHNSKTSEDIAISPSVYSNASSASSVRRRSSTESADARSLSSRSSASAHDSHAAFKHIAPAQSARPPLPPPRKESASSGEISPRQSPLSGIQLSSGKYVPPRRPAGGQQGPRSQTPPQQYPSSFRPHGHPAPPHPHADPHGVLRNNSPMMNPAFGRSSPDLARPPAYPSSRSQSPIPPPPLPYSAIQRSHSPLARPRNDHAPPPVQLPRHSPQVSLRSAPLVSSFQGNGPFSAGSSMHSPSLSTRSAGTRTPPPFVPHPGSVPRSRTPQPPHAPSWSQPTSPTELPLSDTEITALWSHASLLYHNKRVNDALDMLHKLVERPGTPPLTLARLHLNVGIMTECLAKGRVVSKTPTNRSAENMIHAFEKAIKLSPDGLEGALGTFLLGCALFDTHDFHESAACFDLCEAVFVGEADTVNFRASANEPWNEGRRPSTVEYIDFKPLGMDYVMYLSDVRENWRIAQERVRNPSGLGTMNELQRLPMLMIVEEPLAAESVNLSPVDESDEEVENVRSTLGIPPDEGELIPMRLDLGGGRPPQTPMRRRTTKKQDREEMERRREARRTRILIKLGDLRLNKPLPPLPNEREAMKRAQVPAVPPLPIVETRGGMPFV